MRKLLIVLAYFFMALVLAGSASAATLPQPANPDAVSTDDSAIDGHNIVYQQRYTDNDYDIYKKDLTTGTTTKVTDSTRDDRNPDISGNIVVWQSKETGGNWQIYWKNTTTNNLASIVHADAGYAQTNPKISGNFVVWQQYDSAADAETGGSLPDENIKGYNLVTNTYYPHIASRAQFEGNPDISGNTVVYQIYENLGTEDSPDWHYQVYKTAFGTTNSGRHVNDDIYTEDPKHVDQKNPSISGNIALWSESCVSGYEIWCCEITPHTGHDMSPLVPFLLVSTLYAESFPTISGYTVVWSDYSSVLGDLEIYMNDITGNNPVNVDVSNLNQFSPVVGVDPYGIFVSYTNDEDGYNRVYWRNMDINAPIITSSDPGYGSVDIAKNKVIKITFSEPIKNGSGWIELLNSGGTAIPITKSISGNILTITPNTLLSTGTKYTIALHTGSITDYAVNPLTGVIRVFTTSTDAMPPTVTSSNPTNNAVNIARNKVISITFNEPIKAGNMWIELKSNSGTIIPITKSISGNVLTITPNALLATGTKYNILLHTGSITDYAGNSIASAVRSFTTSSDATAPTVTSSDPANNAVNIARNKVIKVTFSEPLQWGNWWIELKNNIGTTIPITMSITSNVLTINHAALLAPGTKYNILLHTGSVTDVAGNPLAAKVISFTTGST